MPASVLHPSIRCVAGFKLYGLQQEGHGQLERPQEEICQETHAQSDVTEDVTISLTHRLTKPVAHWPTMS